MAHIVFVEASVAKKTGFDAKIAGVGGFRAPSAAFSLGTGDFLPVAMQFFQRAAKRVTFLEDAKK